MKDNYLLVLGILMLLLPLSAAGQELVWENTFDTPEERAGWIFYDGNNNSNTWNIGKHVVRKAATPNMYEEVSPDYVLRHSAYKPNVVGGPANFQDDYIGDFEDWVISPEIDLTAASGDITLAAMIGRVITYNTTSASNNTHRSIFVYVSSPEKSVPDVSDFIALRDYIKTSIDNDGSLSNSLYPKALSITNADYVSVSNALFAQATADLSQYAGKKIYIGFWHNTTSGINERTFKDSNSSNTFQIDEIQVYAEQLSVNIPVDYSWLKAATIAVEGNIAKVVGPDADKFTKFYINDQAVELTAGHADLTGKTGALSLKATTADSSGVIRLKISK